MRMYAKGRERIDLAEALKQDVPGIKYIATTDWLKPHGLAVGGKKLYVHGALAGA